MTAADFQSLGISEDKRERLKILEIGAAIIFADNFRKIGSNLSSPADLWGSSFCNSINTSAVWIELKEKGVENCVKAVGHRGVVAVGQLAWGREFKWEAWPASAKCLLKFTKILTLSVMMVLSSFKAVGSWEEITLFSRVLTVSQNFLEFVWQAENFRLKKWAFVFLIT